MAKKESFQIKELEKNTIKPVISGITKLSRKIILDWEKGNMDGVIIFTCYDGANFTMLKKCAHPPFEDKRKNLSYVTPESRYYKMRYFKNDVPVGLESDVVKVTAEIFVPE